MSFFSFVLYSGPIRDGRNDHRSGDAQRAGQADGQHVQSSPRMPTPRRRVCEWVRVRVRGGGERTSFSMTDSMDLAAKVVVLSMIRASKASSRPCGESDAAAGHDAADETQGQTRDERGALA